MSTRNRMVVSIDWDYFTGDCQGYGSPCKVCLWNCAGIKTDTSARQENDAILKEYPHLVGVKTCEGVNSVKKFLTRIGKKLTGAQLVVADCHGSIYRLLGRGDTVVNYDAHEDRESDNDYTNCANWAGNAVERKGIEYIWVYPKYSGKLLPWEKAGLVFICLSSPYTPPKYDDKFYDFVEKVSGYTGSTPKFIGLGAWKLKRKFEEH